jgi:hypothetical protein
MSREAMKLALEALEEITDEVFSPYDNKLGKAITALREALAEQPAQKCSYPYCGCNSKAWCKVERNEALDKKAENARALGLDYEPAQQEPVAWVCYGSNNKLDIDFFDDEIADLAVGTMLYTHAQRTWVGLTDEDIWDVYTKTDSMQYMAFSRAIEAKLRSKNNG